MVVVQISVNIHFSLVKCVSIEKDEDCFSASYLSHKTKTNLFSSPMYAYLFINIISIITGTPNMINVT